MVPSTGDRNPNKTFPSSRSALIAENKECVMMRVECSNTHGNKIVPREWGRLLGAMKCELSLPNRSPVTLSGAFRTVS